MGQRTRGFIQIEDYDNEKSGVSVHLANIGIAGATYASETQNLDEIKDAILDVILGEVRETTITDVFTESSAVVTDQNAQRELKWAVMYRDTSQFLDVANSVPNQAFNRIFKLEIPTANPALLDPTAKDRMDITTAATPGLALKNSLEANMRSPYGGTITVLEVILVGRNN